MPSQSQVFLLPANFVLDGMKSHKHDLAAKYSFKKAAFKVEFRASSETNLFRIAPTLESETSVSRKTQCLLATGRDKKVRHEHMSKQSGRGSAHNTSITTNTTKCFLIFVLVL